MKRRATVRRLGVIAASLLGCGTAPALAEDYCAPSEVTDPQPLHINGSTPFVYKTVGNAELRLHVFSSGGLKPGAKAPAVVFFFGGGWIFGDIRRYQTQATHLALRGIVTVLVDYRVKCRHGSTIMDSVSDGKSAMRWVRGHANELGVDPKRIAIVGSSAGGQMAAAAALINDFDDPADDLKVDPRPNALILYNPALDLAEPNSVAFITQIQGKAVADRGRDLSPLLHLKPGLLPPTIIFQGTDDRGAPIVNNFCAKARSFKAQCDVVTYQGAPHGFTEIWMALDKPVLGLKTEKWAEDTSRQTDAFLTKLGWMTKR
jgi:acetyl esterase